MPEEITRWQRKAAAEGGGVLRPRSIEEARHAVGATRARISLTLDEIQDRLERRRRELRDRLDVPHRLAENVRDHPWRALAVAFGVGLALGRLRGK